MTRRRKRVLALMALGLDDDGATVVVTTGGPPVPGQCDGLAASRNQLPAGFGAADPDANSEPQQIWR
jgi:hypothetical protein